MAPSLAKSAFMNTALLFALNMLWLPPGHSPAVISKVRTDPIDDSADLTGSVNGGARIYFCGAGFDNHFYKNAVQIGGVDCLVDDYYTSETLLVCQMAEQFYGTRSELEIAVTVKGEAVLCADCKVDLRLDRTPLLYSVQPQAVFAGQNVDLRGIWRSATKSAIREIRIADANCLVGQEAFQSDNTLSYGNADQVGCQVPPDLESGDHKVRIAGSQGTGLDFPQFGSTNFKVGSEAKTYNLRVHPKVTAINGAETFVSGKIIEISGQGFSADPESIEVTVGGSGCRVVSSSATAIACELAPVAEVPTGVYFLGGAGALHTVYEGRSSSSRTTFRAPTCKQRRAELFCRWKTDCRTASTCRGSSAFSKPPWRATTSFRCRATTPARCTSERPRPTTRGKSPWRTSPKSVS